MTVLAGCADRSTSRSGRDASAAASPEPSRGAEKAADTEDPAEATEPEDAGELAADTAEPPPRSEPDASGDIEEAPPPVWVGPPPLVMSSKGRVVAIGDVHGDLDATRRALRLGGLIDEDDHWIGEHSIAVQVGDQTDRGDDEQAILDLFEVLAQEAYAAGGAFVSLIGNHEQMNAQLDFRYVTEGGFADFADFAESPDAPADPRVAELPAEQRGRAIAFLPGGPYALKLAGHNVVQIVDTTLFVHGGVQPSHVGAGLGLMNAEHSAWLRGEGELSSLWSSDASPVWDRTYSDDTTAEGCALLEETLDQLDLERMVVAHTVQSGGINTACDGKVFRVDVGLAAHYGGPTQVLEILGGATTILQ